MTEAKPATINNNEAIVSSLDLESTICQGEKAIRNAVNKLLFKLEEAGIKKTYALVDGFAVKYLGRIGLNNQKVIIKGDQKSISIAAASIIAKVQRDQNMVKLDQKYPIYFWKRNKGYGTSQHINAIIKYGKSSLHRDLFLRKILNFIT